MRVGRQLPTSALPTEASYRSSAPVDRRYTLQSPRSPNDTQKNGATHSIVRNGEAHILACHQLGLLVPKIRPASPQNTANKKPKTIIGSMITS